MLSQKALLPFHWEFTKELRRKEKKRKFLRRAVRSESFLRLSLKEDVGGVRELKGKGRRKGKEEREGGEGDGGRRMRKGKERLEEMARRIGA